MTGRYVCVVMLWVHDGQEAAFETFEREAARIMVRHDGRIDQAIRISPTTDAAPGGDAPYEVHIVSFASEAGAQAYAADPETLALRNRRDGIISRTWIMAGRFAGAY